MLVINLQTLCWSGTARNLMSLSCCQYLLDGLGSIVSILDIQPLVSMCFCRSEYCQENRCKKRPSVIYRCESRHCDANKITM